jgi:Phage integrase, N-terminal SAM-like domain
LFAVAADEGRVVERSRRTVAEYLREWLAALRPRVRPTTLASYEAAVGRILREIGQVPLQALTDSEASLVGPARVRQPHPGGQLGWHVDDLFARGDELLSEQGTGPGGASTAHSRGANSVAQLNRRCRC